MDANQIKFRCSGLGNIMKEPRAKSEVLAETCKTHLVDLYLSFKYSRREDVNSKFLKKGNEREEDSITLVTMNTKKVYFKNEERRENEYITGLWDIDNRTSEGVITETGDTKTSWSMHTFMRSKYKPLDDMYYYQGNGYMGLTGALKHNVYYCLVNGTVEAINIEKRRASFNYIDPENSDAYLQQCKQIEINHIFDRAAFENENPYFDWAIPRSEWSYDVPLAERMHTFTFERDEEELKRIYQRIVLCRNWMNENLFKI